MPLISVITPVGGNHAVHLPVAVASVIQQTISDWEMVVVNDGQIDIPAFQDKRVKVIDSPNRRSIEPYGNRASVARNQGIKHATGDYIVFLDADDYLLPKAFETYVRGQATHDRTYTYSSHYSNSGVHLRPPAYNQEKYKTFNIHPITAFVPRSAVVDVGGFDENAPGWDDWTLWLRLAIKGYCGSYVRGPTFVYQDQHSINHHVDIAGGKQLMDKVIEPYKVKGDIIMAKCCGANRTPLLMKQVKELQQVTTVNDGSIVVEYIGPMKGSFIVRHPVTKREYRSGGTETMKYVKMHPDDVEFFVSTGKFRRSVDVTPYMPPPSPAPYVADEYVPDAETQAFVDAIPKLTEANPVQATVESESIADETSAVEPAMSADVLAEMESAIQSKRGRKRA
jgi:GT2 family glycosyltransferase